MGWMGLVVCGGGLLLALSSRSWMAAAHAAPPLGGGPSSSWHHQGVSALRRTGLVRSIVFNAIVGSRDRPTGVC